MYECARADVDACECHVGGLQGQEVTGCCKASFIGSPTGTGKVFAMEGT